MRAVVRINPASRVLRDHGLDRGGHAQRFWTSTVLRRIQRYMPYRGGEMIKETIAQTDLNKPQIVTDTPGARMLYHGKVMVDPQTGVAGFPTENGWKSRRGVGKVVSNRDIQYTTTKNAKAGPYWDWRLKADEMRVMVREMQAYINR